MELLDPVAFAERCQSALRSPITEVIQMSSSTVGEFEGDVPVFARLGVVTGGRVAYSENVARSEHSKVCMFRLAGTAAQQAVQSGYATASRESSQKRPKDAWTFFESMPDASHAIFAAVPCAGEPGGPSQAVLVIGWKGQGPHCCQRKRSWVRDVARALAPHLPEITGRLQGDVDAFWSGFHDHTAVVHRHSEQPTSHQEHHPTENGTSITTAVRDGSPTPGVEQALKVADEGPSSSGQAGRSLEGIKVAPLHATAPTVRQPTLEDLGIDVLTLRFKDHAREHRFAHVQARGALEGDSAMWMALLFCYYLLPFAMCADLRVEKQIMFGLLAHGFVLAVPACLLLFEQATYIQYRCWIVGAIALLQMQQLYYSAPLGSGLHYLAHPAQGIPGLQHAGHTSRLVVMCIHLFRDAVGLQIRFAFWAPLRTLGLMAVLMSLPATWSEAFQDSPACIATSCATMMIIGHLLPMYLGWRQEKLQRVKFAAGEERNSSNAAQG